MLHSETIGLSMSEAKSNSVTAVVKEYSRRLLGFIRKRVDSEQDAEDILQDVFYQLLGNKEPIDQMASWLFQVTRNKIIDRSRKKKPELLDSLFAESDDGQPAEWMDILLDDSSNPETIYLRNLFQETLKQSLDELPPEQKQAFVLNEMEDIPFKQIAEQTGVSVNTLISRKRYAVLHLRSRLTGLYDALNNY